MVFAAWLVLYLITRKSVKGAISVIFLAILTLIIVTSVMPNVLAVIIDRFGSADMATGNGRFTQIPEYFREWDRSIATMIFGIGLYNCEVHCMPLQFFFGGGIVLFCLMIAFFFSFIKQGKGMLSLGRISPMLVTFLMMCSVPVAGMLNFMFPMVFVGLFSNNIENSDGCKESKYA